MTLNDSLIKLTIADYIKTRSNNSIKKFQELTYYFVKSWPRRQYKCNEDICSDFLIFILEATKEILKSYPENLSISFQTWFSAVLYNKFNDFCKTGSVPSQDLKLYSEVEDIITIPNEYNNEDRFDLLEIVKSLPDLEASLIIFYYMSNNIVGQDLKNIVEFTKKDLSEVTNIYQEMVGYQTECFEQRQSYEQKINATEHKIAHLKNIILKMENNEKLEMYELKLLHLENRKYCYLQKLKCINKNSLKIFSKLFVDYNAAYRMMKKMEILIRRKMI